jgi:hypothetical protein
LAFKSEGDPLTVRASWCFIASARASLTQAIGCWFIGLIVGLAIAVAVAVAVVVVCGCVVLRCASTAGNPMSWGLADGSATAATAAALQKAGGNDLFWMGPLDMTLESDFTEVVGWRKAPIKVCLQSS